MMLLNIPTKMYLLILYRLLLAKYLKNNVL
jgi:hypothetical protein